MKPNKRLAAGVAAAMAVGGIAVISTVAAPAQAASTTVNLYSQINNVALSGSVARGSKIVTMTVTPTSTNVGNPIEVQVGSSNFAFSNGPAAIVTANGSELDAVISLNGVDYVLRGSQNNQPISTNDSIFNTNWVTSSTPGNSSSSSTNTVAQVGPPATTIGTVTGTTGLGTAVRGAEGTIVALTAPGAAGTYTIGLKALVNNSVAGTGTPALTDNFDEITNTDATNAGGAAGTVGPGGPTGSFALNVQPGNNGTTAGGGNVIFGSPVVLTAIGPNGVIATSTGQNAGLQVFRKPLPSLTGYVDNPSFIGLTGSVWSPGGGFTTQFCDVTGASCNTATAYTITNTLSADGSGNLTGSISVLQNTFETAPTTSITAGSRAIKLTQGANTALVPVLILTTPTVTRSPASGGPGTVVAATGANFNPGQAVQVRGTIGATASTSLTWTATSDAAVAGGNANASGNAGPVNFTVNDSATTGIAMYQGGSIVIAAPTASNYRASTSFTVNQDRCVAWNDNVTAGSCTTKQNVNVSVLQGKLTQRAYTNVTPTVGSIDGSAITSPVGGTSNVNSNATTVNLGTITSPLAPATIVGNLNDITVSDNRGGTNGWTLSATMTGFTGVPSGTLANGQLTASPTCVVAPNAQAWDYSAVGQTAIAGFDNTLTALGNTAGAANQSFSGTVNLCTKNNTVNGTTQTTGGVWNVGAPLTLTVPAFQLAAKYAATMTITLA